VRLDADTPRVRWSSGSPAVGDPQRQTGGEESLVGRKREVGGNRLHCLDQDQIGLGGGDCRGHLRDVLGPHRLEPDGERDGALLAARVVGAVAHQLDRPPKDAAPPARRPRNEPGALALRQAVGAPRGRREDIRAGLRIAAVNLADEPGLLVHRPHSPQLADVPVTREPEPLELRADPPVEHDDSARLPALFEPLIGGHRTNRIWLQSTR
jgi:hypothetical protein